MLSRPRVTCALLRALVLATVLFTTATAEAGIRYYRARWMPQGEIAADGYDVYLRLAGAAEWAQIPAGYIEENDRGVVRFTMILNDDRDYELAVRAYVTDGADRLYSDFSNVIDVEAVVVRECDVNADCDDGNVCNGSESCQAGVCATSEPLACEDPGPCQAAICDPVHGCLVVEDPDDPACAPEPECTVDADCGDGDVCNGAESCIGGLCYLGEELVCEDPGPCEAAVCDPLEGCVVVEDPDDPECPPDPELDGVSVDLDGLGEQLGTTGPVELGVDESFTLSLWVKPANLDGADRYIFDAFTPGDYEDDRIAVFAENGRAGDPIRVRTFSSWGSDIFDLEFAGHQVAGRWLHVVVAQEGPREMTVFIDGQPASPSRVRDDGSFFGFMSDDGREVAIGSDYSRLRNFWEGAIGHVALWDHALSAAEVAEIFAAGHAIDLRADQGDYASSAGLRHYWRLGEDLDRLGADFVAESPVHLDQTVGLDETDVVSDAP